MAEEQRAASELERLWESDDARAVLEAIMRFTPGISVIASSPDRVLYVSEFASRLVGRPRSELENVRLEQHFAAFVALDEDGRRLRDDERPVMRALRGETVIREAGAVVVGGVAIPVVCNAAPIQEQGRVIGAVLACADVRHERRLEQELRDFAAEREVLYRELTHRVKNHLQIMAAVTSLESREASLTSAEVAMRTGQRLQVLASVYDRMTQRDCGARVETRGFLEDLCAPYRSEEVRIEVTVSPPDLTLASDRASTFGMLVNEALCNSYKHAFPDRNGEVRVELRRDGEQLSLSVADNGVGRGALDPTRPSHGLKLMGLHARQLAGRLEVADAAGGGTVVSVVMPVEA